jgi:hypothetical protein
MWTFAVFLRRVIVSWGKSSESLPGRGRENNHDRIPTHPGVIRHSVIKPKKLEDRQFDQEARKPGVKRESDISAVEMHP